MAHERIFAHGGFDNFVLSISLTSLSFSSSIPSSFLRSLPVFLSYPKLHALAGPFLVEAHTEDLLSYPSRSLRVQAWSLSGTVIYVRSSFCKSLEDNELILHVLIYAPAMSKLCL